MKERESLLCLYFILGDRNDFKPVPFIKAKCFHFNAFFNDLMAKELEVETSVRRKELKTAKEARSGILHTHKWILKVERSACSIRIWQQA
jgi:hypothetical protein